MLKKGYLFLIVVTSIFYIVCKQQFYIPNQEIVIQFDGKDLTKEYAENTKEEVLKQLQNLGVNNVKVKTDNNRVLKITYYSKAPIHIVRKVFSSHLQNSLVDNKLNESTDFPSEEKESNCNLDIYEIKTENISDRGFNGLSVAELESKSHRFLSPNSYFILHRFNYNNFTHQEQLYNTTYCVNTLIKSLALEAIPDVRAGPRT